MDFISDPNVRKDSIYLLAAVVLILVINYLFLFGTGNKTDPVTRSDVFMLMAIDAILGAIFYWSSSHVIDREDKIEIR